MRDNPGVYPFDEISAMQFAFEKFSGSTFFSFFHLRLFDGVRFQYFQILVSFIFSDRFDFSLI